MLRSSVRMRTVKVTVTMLAMLFSKRKSMHSMMTPPWYTLEKTHVANVRSDSSRPLCRSRYSSGNCMATASLTSWSRMSENTGTIV